MLDTVVGADAGRRCHWQGGDSTGASPPWRANAAGWRRVDAHDGLARACEGGLRKPTPTGPHGLPDIPRCYVTTRAGCIAFLGHFCHRVVSAEPQPATDSESLRRVIKWRVAASTDRRGVPLLSCDGDGKFARSLIVEQRQAKQAFVAVTGYCRPSIS